MLVADVQSFFFLFTFRLLSWLKNSVKYTDIINFLSFTCKFIIHNAFLSPLLLNSWLSVQTKFRIKSVTRQPLGVENPYSSDIAEFSANPAVCRRVKTCHLSWWRHEFLRTETRRHLTWKEKEFRKSYIIITEARWAFLCNKYWL